MNSVYFGIVIGVFLCLAGQRFFKMATKALKERKIDNEQRLVKIVNEIVNKSD